MKKLSLAMKKLLAIRLGYPKTLAKSLVIVLSLAPTFAHAWPWSDDMVNQISIKPQESVDSANPGMNSFPKRSVPVPATATSQAVKDQDAADKLPNPVPADAKSVDTGGRLFTIYCTPCHGKSGTGDGYVGEKLMMKPFNLTSSNDMHPWNTKEFPDGYIFGKMTFGGVVMPPYANDLSPTERWHVVNYIRAVLQKNTAAAAAAQTK